MENCAVFTVYLSISFSWSSWKQCGIFNFISCMLLVNIEIPFSFVCWSCILWHCWIHLILRDFGRFPGIFYAKNNVICKYRQFYISFPNLKMSFISFFFFFFASLQWLELQALYYIRVVSKSLQAINAGEGVEKREPSYTVGGNAN